MKTKRVIEFGPFRLDGQARQLWRGGERVTLTPKVFDTLRYMVENPGRLLTKEELLKAVWPDRFVDEANLTQNISVLRRALGEVGSATKYIGTFHGRGYQFLAAVSPADVPLDLENPLAPRSWRNWTGVALASLLACGAGLALWRNRPQPGPQFGPPVPLTRLPGSEYQPAISRDGAKIAFVWDQESEKGAAIYVKGPEDDEPRRISPTDHVHDSPAWSPDGKYLAYLRYERDALVVVVRPERGVGVREVARLFPTRYGLNYRHLDWSPDGKHLAVDDKPSQDGPFGVDLIEVSTGRRTPLAKLAVGMIGAVEPRFSPDGAQISFIGIDTRFHHELYTVPVSGGEPQARTQDGRLISGQDWAPDGRSIYFGSNRDGSYRLWRAGVSSAGMATGMQPVSIASANPIQLSVARTGARIVYSDLVQDLNIWRLDLAAAARREPVWTRTVASTGEDILPYLSPDGARLCFLSDRSGDQELWVAASDGSGPRQLTRGRHRPVACRWSPDGRTIVFHQLDSPGIYLVDANGGVPRLFPTTLPEAGHPVFSAGGSALYFGESGRVLLGPLDGSPAREVLSRNTHQKIPSADGRYLYFTGGRTDTTIWRVPAAGGVPVRLVEGLLPGYWGAWALGARGLYYLAADAESTSHAVVRRKDLLTGADAQVAAFPGRLPPIGASTWSLAPGDRFLYCVRTDVSHSDITLIGDGLPGR